ncbi:DotD/TraH family lipoprotein [Brucella thiophenivorans]|uniref:DotD/TraH family lipoprotein n=1 Tax=Brucella thiophenivorans TaxID=571255 RepID=UPI000B9821B8|nr:DotD/TraH family lipoprotein [Brucella thiophenivorans]
MKYILLAGVVLLSGCAQSPKFNTKPIGPMIEKNIDSIVEEKRFVYLEKGVINPRPIGVITMVRKETPSGSLMSPMNATFQGTIEDLVKVVASRIGFSVSKYGERSGAPILVSVNASNSTPYYILEEGLLQAQGQVRITIDQAHKSITVRYKRPERSPVAHIDDTRL